jgi:glutaredoxin
MYIKQLIRNKEEYWDFVWTFLDWTIEPYKSLWRKEDYPKLEPFFKMQNRVEEWTDEVKESYAHYKKCNEEYGSKNTEIRDAVSKFSPDELLEAFGYEDREYNEEDEEEWSKDKPQKLHEDISFPFIVIGDMHCGWDRSGDFRIMSIYQVYLKDFNI